MNISKRKLNKIASQYKKKNKKLESLPTDITQNLDCFVARLQYLRDYLILTGQSSLDSGVKILSLGQALAAYQLYKNAVFEYYTYNDLGILTHRQDYSAEEAREKYGEAKKNYWGQFWDLVSTYAESWEN